MDIPPEVRAGSHVIPSVDGYPLAATSYESPFSRGLVLINSAVGVKQTYYRRFASYLAERGLDVLTYDYRGIGKSAPAPVRASEARMRDWGLMDFPAVVDWCSKRRTDGPLFVVGHSVGGQILGLAANNVLIRGAVIVCAQKTYWGLWPASHYPRLWTLWYVLLPGLSRTMGYFPSQWFGLGENLPKGVALEWAQWARAREHTPEVIGEHVRPGYADYKGEILAYSFSDDSFAPKATVDGLLDMFTSAVKTHRHYSPKGLGRSIGHFGFFREEFRDGLWSEVADWLMCRVEATSV